MISLMKATRKWFWTVMIALTIIGSLNLSNLFQYKQVLYFALPISLIVVLFLGHRFSYQERRDFLLHSILGVMALRFLVMLFHEPMFNNLAVFDLAVQSIIYATTKLYYRSVQATMEDHWFKAELQRSHRATEE